MFVHFYPLEKKLEKGISKNGFLPSGLPMYMSRGHFLDEWLIGMA